MAAIIRVLTKLNNLNSDDITTDSLLAKELIVAQQTPSVLRIDQSSQKVGILIDNPESDLHVNGNILSTTISLLDGFTSNLLPNTNDLYDLGSFEKEWNSVYANNIITSGDITVGGNLAVNGTLTYINTENLNIGDNIIVLNSGLSSQSLPIINAGIEVNRGQLSNVSFLWDEINDVWTVGNQKISANTFIGTFSGNFDSNTESTMDDRYVNASGDIMLGDLAVSGEFSATSKSFVINHPIKLNYKLKYGSLEGPENGVYIRATVHGTNEFLLPDYWVKLVDPTTITVNLTSIGMFQPLYVVNKSIEKIIVAANGVEIKDLDFDIIVFAERNDINKLVVEYQEITN